MENTIYQRIRRRRQELGMSQEELAKKIGYSHKTAVCKIEAGQRKLKEDVIVKLASALDTTPSYLMGWDNEEDYADPLLPLSREEENIIRNYRASDESTQLAVCAVLGVKKDVGCLDSRRNA